MSAFCNSRWPPRALAAEIRNFLLCIMHSVCMCCRIDWEDKSLPGAERVIVVDIDKCRLLPSGSIPFMSGPVTDWSPYNPAS
jgi:hypothetical protein